MENLKKEFAIAAAQANLQIALAKNPGLSVGEFFVQEFVTTCKFYDSPRGKELLRAAEKALNTRER